MTQTICPKCKKEVNENDIRCPHCNMRLKQICPSCNTANQFGVEKCLNCGTVLLKYCENCGSANLAAVAECRKCRTPFEKEVITFEKNRSKNKQPSTPFTNIKVEEQKISEQLPEEKITTPIEGQPVIDNSVIEEKPQTAESEPQQEIKPEPADENLEEIGKDEEITEIEKIEELPTEPIVEEKEIAEEKEPVVQEPQHTNIDDLLQQDIPLTDNIDEEKEIVYFDNADNLLEQLTNIMETQNNAIIAGICAEEGMGKSTVVKTFVNSMAEKGTISILSENTELLKLSPFGTIRDALLKLLTLPDIHPDANSFFNEDTKQLFIQNFATLTNEEIEDFMNFLYPSKHSDFDSITANRVKTFNLLEKIFATITTQNKSIFIIDNFELIDIASFDLIQNLIKKGIINNQTKLFITYKENKPARVYFDSAISKQNIFTTLCIKNMDEEATLNMIMNFTNTQQVPTAVSFAVNEKGHGNIFFTEQFLALLFDSGYMFISSNMMKFKEDEPIPFLPKSIEEVIKLRFSAINQAELRDSLITAAIMGCKFDKTAFAAITDISEEQSAELLQKLTDLMFLQPASEYEYSFKNLTEWSVIFEIAQNDPRFKVICKKVYYILGKYALSNPIIKATVAKYRDEAETATQSWRETAALCAYLGDTTIYALALDQFLKNSGYTEDNTEYSDVQLEAMEKIAKLTYKANPQQAIKYLTPSIIAAKEEGNSLAIVDLCGYLIKSCYEICDYNGVIEAVDLIVKSSEDEMTPLNKALVLSRKLHALFKIGNCEEGINLANNDIIPKLEEALSKENDNEFAKSLFNAWFEASLNMIYLYSLQGNSKAVEIADNTSEIMQMNNIKKPTFTVKLNLAKAFALTIVGKIQDSIDLLTLTEKIEEYNQKEFIAARNLVFTLNLVFTEKTDNLRELLLNYARYAENANDQLGKHIYKLVLAWLTCCEGDFAKANVIFNDELTYFAKEKIVTGALISWLFIAKNTLETEGAENAERIAMKALEVAQNPKFSQYHTAVYLQKLIAEINLIKGDSSAAKMYLEKGMLIAKQFGLDLAQIELYRTYSKFLAHSMQQQGIDKRDCANKADKIYQAAIASAEKINVPGMVEKISQEQQAFKAYCSQNGINLK